MQIKDVMRRLRAAGLPVLAMGLCAGGSVAAPTLNTATQLPHLEKRGKAMELLVDGQPFLVLGGELHNSSSSSIQYMQTVWARLAAMHLNTVLAPVAWETIEPEPGHFDFSTVDGLLTGSRNSQLKRVILWIGAWKNTCSTCVPAWVKADSNAFARSFCRR